MDDELRQLMSETFLAKLPDDATAPLRADAIRLEFAPGSRISEQEGSTRRVVGLVASGLVRISRLAANGRIVTQRYMRRGDVGGITALFAGRAVGQGHALVASTIYLFSGGAWEEAARHDVRVAHALLLEVSRISSLTFEHLAAERLATIRQRLVQELLDIAADRQSGPELIVPVTQQQLADGIGSAREVVARVLRGLRDENLVATGSRGVVLLDPIRLQSELQPA